MSPALACTATRSGTKYPLAPRPRHMVAAADVEDGGVLPNAAAIAEARNTAPNATSRPRRPEDAAAARHASTGRRAARWPEARAPHRPATTTTTPSATRAAARRRAATFTQIGAV